MIPYFSSVFLLVLCLFTDYTLSATGPTHGKVVVCYIGTWAVYRPGRGSFSLEHIDPNVCTHLVYSFAGLNTTHEDIKSLDPWQDLTENYGKGGYERIINLKLRYPHLRVTLAIGGWNEGSSNYSSLVASPVRRGKFVANALEFIRKYDFDGLDLDWEFPGKRGGSPQDKQNFVLLCKELRSAFNKIFINKDLLLTAAFGAGKDTIDIAYDVSAVSVYLDYIHMMCYDYHGAWDQKTGANAPLRSQDVYNVEYTVNYMLQMGAPSSKLVVGLPLYGRTFLLQEAQLASKKTPKLGEVARNIGFQGPYTRENGFMGYNEICEVLKNTSSGYKQFWDDETSTPYAVNGDKVITFDNEKSLYEKVKFAMEKDLAGAMVWSLDTDDFHGDCADDLDNNPKSFTNFPLMRAINKGIEDSLEDIRRNKENEIPHGAEDQKSGANHQLAIFGINLIVLVSFLF